MRQYLTMLAAAAACGSILAVQAGAQSTTESKTKVKVDHGKTVTYTGCVQNGNETRSYVLQDAVPMSRTETKGTSGTTTTTTYMLMPSGKVELQQSVGHKVEITAVLIKPGKGDAKIKTETKGGTTHEETKTEVERGRIPQLRVVSVKPLGESC